jgi:putative Holliday junction resolvase
MDSGVFLGIDYGLARIGLAKSDISGLLASPYKTIEYKSINRAIEQVIVEIGELSAVGVVVGYPVALSGGNQGERCRMVDAFIDRLKKKYGGPIYRMDERDSSAEAEDIIHIHGKKIGKKKDRVDKIAAAIILQRFLDERKKIG